jgi:hypothetical protein
VVYFSTAESGESKVFAKNLCENSINSFLCGEFTRNLARSSGSLSGVPETFRGLRRSRRVFPKACQDLWEAVGYSRKPARIPAKPSGDFEAFQEFKQDPALYMNWMACKETFCFFFHESFPEVPVPRHDHHESFPEVPASRHDYHESLPGFPGSRRYYNESLPEIEATRRYQKLYLPPIPLKG